MDASVDGKMKTEPTIWTFLLAYALSGRAQAIASDMGISDRPSIEPINYDELIPDEFMRKKTK